MPKRGLLIGALLIGAVLVPGLACKSGGESGVDALVEGEAAPGDSASVQELGVVPIDTTNDARSVAGRLQDVSIAANVRLRLADEANVNVTRISTEVQNGRVVLQGEVASAEQRQRAEELAGQVDGVRQVVNQLSAPDAPPIVAEPEPAPPITEAQPPVQPPAETPPAEAPAEPEEEPEPQAPAEQFHTVRSGDNLWEISRQYGTSIADIRRLNNLSSDNLRPGQRLRVK